MKYRKVSFLAIIASVLFMASSTVPHALEVNSETPVWEVLKALGEALPAHLPDESIEGVSAEVGEGLVFKGLATRSGGKKSAKQSKHFVCTSCHNTKREDPSLGIADPQARLEYAAKHNLPFLQGTSLYGVVNRSSFYNGDYEKKYGELVRLARNNLREAIQLCAVECSQGRALKDWEMESILAYLWTIQLTLSDLDMDAQEIASVQSLLNGSPAEKQLLIDNIKKRYLPGSPAHFVAPPADRKAGYDYQGNTDNGQLIYELSCLHCHEHKRYSLFELDRSRLSFQYLARHFPKYSHASVYQVARYGTPPLYGKRAYMPQYTAEKMSDQQMEDLRAYIEWKAKN